MNRSRLLPGFRIEKINEERVACATLLISSGLFCKFKLTMRVAILILFLISIQTYSQKIDMGRIEADPGFDCSKYTFIDPLYGLGTIIDSMYKVNNICHSKNQIEIRFTTSYAPTQIFEIIVLSYNNNSWEGKKYEFNTDTLYYDSTLNANAGKIKIYQLHTTKGFDSFFESLKKNNIFSLPDQNDINDKPKGPVCGIIHTLTFKAGDRYRTYQFSNPEYYIKKTKDKNFKNYYNIRHLLSNELQKK